MDNNFRRKNQIKTQRGTCVVCSWIVQESRVAEGESSRKREAQKIRGSGARLHRTLQDSLRTWAYTLRKSEDTAGF